MPIVETDGDVVTEVLLIQAKSASLVVWVRRHVEM